MSLVVVDGVSNASAQTPAAAPITVTERSVSFSDNSAPNLSPDQAPMSTTTEVIGSSASSSVASSNNNEPPVGTFTETTLTVSNSVSGLCTSTSSNTVLSSVAVLHPMAGENENVPQGQKLLTASPFPPAPKVLNNGQRTNTHGPKVKIIQNVITPATNNYPTSKAGLTKYVNQNSYPPAGGNTITGNGAKIQLPSNAKLMASKSAFSIKSSDLVKVNHYPTHKTHIKQHTSVGGFVPKAGGGIKTIPPQQKSMTAQQIPMRTTGIKTLPPQRPPASQKPKTNYIGKHTPPTYKTKNYPGINKMTPHKVQKRPISGSSLGNRYNSSALPPNPQISVNQALTAQILQSLGDGSSSRNSYVEPTQPQIPNNQIQRYQHEPHSYPAKVDTNNERRSTLADLSAICRYILLDHNYVASPPSVSPRQPPPQPISHHNGVGLNSLSTGTPSYTSLTPNSLIGSSSVSTLHQEDDAASDISSGGDRKPETEGEETETAPEAENDPEVYEGSVTRCICDYTHDDGYMLQCDKCKVWQHVKCIFKNAAEANLPDNYFCEMCDPSLVTDKHKARLVQQTWLKEDKARREQILREATLLEARKNLDHLTDTSSSDGEHHPHNNNVVPKRRGPVSGTGGRRKSEPINRRPNLSAIASRRQRRESARDNLRRTPVKRKERKITKRKAKSRVSIDDDDESQDVWPSPSAAAHLPLLRQWIEKYEEAVTNHYSPELRARISNLRLNGAHDSFNVSQADVSVHRCRVNTHALTGMKTVIATQPLSANSAVIELRGKYMLSTQHRNPAHTGMLLTRQHSQKPGPFLFFYRLARDNTTCLEVCVDTRTYGNDARFIRRSCKPNAELRHCLEKGVLHLYVVSTHAVDKNVELTIKHESHDLASVGTTSIACACGLRNEECSVNSKITPGAAANNTASGAAVVTTAAAKKAAAVANAAANGDITENHRKRRGRRTVSVSEPERELMSPPLVPETPSPVAPEAPAPPVPQKQQPPVMAPTPAPQPPPPQSPPPPSQPSTNTRRSSQHNRLPPQDPEAVSIRTSTEHPAISSSSSSSQSADKSENVAAAVPSTTTTTTASSGGGGSSKRNSSNSDSKKLSREDKKMQAYIKAFEKMEKLEQRRQENQARQTQRRESEPGPGPGTRGGGGGMSGKLMDDDNSCKPAKRRKRKGRARTVSTNSQSGSGKRRLRVNSTDSYITSGDENGVLSPKSSGEPIMTTPVKNGNAVHSNLDHLTRGDSDLSSPCRSAVGVLLSLANGDSQGEMHKSPCRESDSNSSPETPLSSACLLVAAAVEPLEPGFKFPKTKKAIMNEWLNKSPADIVQSASSISPSSLTPHLVSNDTSSSNNSGIYSSDSGFYGGNGNKNSMGLGALAQAASFCDSPPQVTGSAKKRWLRQAISEECDSPNSRPETPPASEMAAPPKKRRLPRESLSSEQSFTPPTTPTSVTPPSSSANIGGGCGSDTTTLSMQQAAEQSPLDSGSESLDVQVGAATLSSAPRGEFVKASSAGGGGVSAAPESRVEIVFGSGAEQEDDSPSHGREIALESDAVLKERAAEMQMEFGSLSSQILDPRLIRYNNSENLVGTVEKTLRFYEEKLGTSGSTTGNVATLNKSPSSSAEHSPVATPDAKRKDAAITPAAAKRKLSISEYRQRKKLNTGDKSPRSNSNTASGNDDNSNLNSEPNSPLGSRRRSNSASSSTSSLSSDDDEDELAALMTCSSTPLTTDLTQPEKVVGFNSAPTELELQRENVSLRLKQALGRSIDEKTVPALKTIGLVDSILGNPIRDLSSTALSSGAISTVSTLAASLKPAITALPATLYPPPPASPPPPPPPASPPASVAVKEEIKSEAETPTKMMTVSVPVLLNVKKEEIKKEESIATEPMIKKEEVFIDTSDLEKTLEKICDQVPDSEPIAKEQSTAATACLPDEPEMFYSPDHEDCPEDSQCEEQEEEHEELETTEEEEGSFPVAYVPPFNNPLYPNSNQLAGFVGSVIDNEPYEGRNPSPPPPHPAES